MAPEGYVNGRALSTEIRTAIKKDFEAHTQTKKIADAHHIAPSQVRKMRRVWTETGEVFRQPKLSGRPRLHPRSPLQLIRIVEPWVEGYMGRFDASHGFDHVKRVVGMARLICRGENAKMRRGERKYVEDIVVLASLLHDVGDRKYLKPGEDGATMVQKLLEGFGADEELSRRVQGIVSAVSYSREVRDPDGVVRALKDWPELAVVQDADRLDAVGAVGVGRCFAFSGARGVAGEDVEGGVAKKGGLSDAREHFDEKLEKLEGMMKTASGRDMTRVKSERLRIFRGWWDEELGLAEIAV